MLRDAIADLRNLLSENNFWSRHIPADGTQENLPDRAVQEDAIDNPLFPQNLNDDILREIPVLDPCYIAIDGRFIQAKSSKRVRLCRFKTFQGLPALQPCVETQEQMKMFEALKEWEAPGQGVYQQARAWACNIQAQPRLPTECRWLAATVYNFANEMLRPDNTPGYQEQMRAWLAHWYGVADILFSTLGLNLWTPEVDWFWHGNVHEVEPDTASARSSDYSTGSEGTVVHHVLSPEARVFIRGSVLHPINRPVNEY
ncbi:hypothetical protein NLG97_g483 [Lecanicillium saksenae]|uniref:Uncharacterized protein n=1 Tax=Lecanicillium saksenae TaxID=468837 RepID=A0ACC1R889_9HYPO|nr:hypothetical protein NLG97_g483 [Lecanicillium saksenae]